jgi:hypothetical protein
MVRIELLPAAHGDAIWVEYGNPKDPRRIVIDGGPAPSYENGLRRRILETPEERRRLDLFVVTHIDADHIDGAILLLREAGRLGVHIEELWFNGWTQLDRFGPAVYAPLQGEFLGGLIDVTPALKGAWNAKFGGGAVQVPDSGEPPEISLPGDAKLTLLSPTGRDLKRLRARWTSAIRDFSPGDTKAALRRLEERREYRPPEAPPVFAAQTYGDDRSVANGSSIAFLLEVEGTSLLLAGDAHARVLAASLGRLARKRDVTRIHLDAMKLPHHGSMSNVTKELLSVVDCAHWLVSTSGAVFEHPDVATAQLIVEQQPREHQRPVVMMCNYDETSTRRLATSAPRPPSPTWSTVFPGESPGPAGGLAVSFGERRPVALEPAPRRPAAPESGARRAKRSRGSR